jgi:hypothetical protein
MRDYQVRLDRLEQALALERMTDAELRALVDPYDLSNLSDIELREIIDGVASAEVMAKVSSQKTPFLLLKNHGSSTYVDFAKLCFALRRRV